MTAAYVSSGHVRLHVMRDGAGPPVVLLHGFPEFWYSWRHQIPALVAHGFSVLAPDMRGANLSDRPTEADDYRIEHLVDDVAALVAASGAPRAHIVGHDWGGLVAWFVAARRPELVSSLTILNAPHPTIYRRTVWRTRQWLRSAYVPVFMMPSLAAPLLAAGNGFLLRRMFTHGAAVRGAFSAGDLQRYVNAARRPGALRAGLSYYRANARLGLQTTPLPRITAPTLVIWGERDPALGVELLHGLEDVTTTLRVERLPGIGHWVQNEAADRVTALLLEFLRSHPGEPVHPSRARQGVTFRHCPSFETRSQIRDNVEATVVSSSPSTFPVSRRLSELSVGTIAQLHEVHLDSEARSVLRGLGLTDASILRVCKQGEPCVVQVHATRIGISSRVARQIMVRPQDDVPGARS